MQNLTSADSELLALRRAGASLSAIAARLGLSKTGVFRRLKELEDAQAPIATSASNPLAAPTQPTGKQLDRDTLRRARAELRAQQKLSLKTAEMERQRLYRKKLHEVCVSLGHALETLELEEPLSESEYQELRQFLRTATRTIREESLSDKELKLAERLYALVNPLIKDLTEQHEELKEGEVGVYQVGSMTLTAIKDWIRGAMGLVRG